MPKAKHNLHSWLAGAIVAAALLAAALWSRCTPADKTPSQTKVESHRPATRGAPVPRGMPKPPTHGAITGWVVDPDGRGVDDAAVAALRQRSPGLVAQPPGSLVATTRTRLGGWFQIDRLVPGSYTLAASAAGFTGALHDKVEVAPGATLDGIKLRLWSGAVMVSGQVLDAGGGPIPGARVLASGYALTADGTHEPRLFQVQAGTDGRYQLQLPQGRHDLQAEADGYASARQSMDLRQDTSKDFLLQPAARIAGRVVTAGAKQPVAGARVQVLRDERRWDRSIEAVTTDERGAFRIDALPPGSFRVTARKEALIGTLGPLALAAAGAIDDLDLVVSPSLTLEGVVTSTSGEPITHARIELTPRHPRTNFFPPSMGPFADETGHYLVDALLPGAYGLQVRASGYAPHFEEVSITVSTKRDFVMSPATGVVTGVVLTPAGQPAASAQVEASATAGRGGTVWSRATTDENGRFTLGGLGAGQLRVTARFQTEVGQVGPEALEAGARREVTVRLAPGAQIAGVVSWDNGSPAAGLSVMIMGAPNSETLRIGTGTGDDGSFTIRGLPAGDISLLVRSSRSRDPSAPRQGHGQARVKVTQGEHVTGVKIVVAR